MVEVIEIEAEEDFPKKLSENKDKLVVVDFFATWCGPCKVIAPKIKEWAETYTDVVFFKVDVDKLPDVAEEQGVTAMPTFIFYKGEKKVCDVVGADPNKLKAKIDEHK